MTPLEVTVKTLTEHRFIGLVPGASILDYVAVCLCGAELPGPGRVGSYEAHAVHVAAMLAAAGVLPTVQEWGVRDEHGRQVEFYAYDTQTEARQAAEDINMMTGAEATVVTRFTGATAWTAEEAGG